MVAEVVVRKLFLWENELQYRMNNLKKNHHDSISRFKYILPLIYINELDMCTRPVIAALLATPLLNTV